MTLVRDINVRFWFLSLLAGTIFTLFALAPQFALWYERGPEWNGSFALVGHDESAYAVYVQSLIDGKPIRNSPYTGMSSDENPSMPHSLFSIQILASYPTATIARLVGVNASAGMILLSVFSGFLSAFAVFWLIYLLCEHSIFSFTATFAVLTLGYMDTGNMFHSLLFNEYVSQSQFAFLRRSVPAISFPFLILFHCFVWKLISSKKPTPVAVTLTIGTICFLIYSYFYHWTAAAAWLVVLGALLLTAKWDLIVKRKIEFISVCMATIGFLVPYFVLISNRDQKMGSIQLLQNTRIPELFELSELIGLLTFVLLFFAWRTESLKFRSPKFLMLLSMAIVPFIVHNQQIVTGQTLQPFHYEMFAVNYTVLIAFIVTSFYCLKYFAENKYTNKLLILALAPILSLGYTGTIAQVKRIGEVNLERDEFAGAILSIQKATKHRIGSVETKLMVASFDFHGFTYPNNDDIPLYTARPVIWSLHQITFSDLSLQDIRKRLFTILHLANRDDQWLAQNIKSNEILRIALFGWGRNETHLTKEFNPITNIEIDRTQSEYLNFRNSYDYKKANETELEYLITYNLAPLDLTVIDKWYEREPAKIFGHYSLHRLKLRSGEHER